MKNILLVTVAMFSVCANACSKKDGGSTPAANHAPVASLADSITGADPFTVDFIVTASDEDKDALTFKWDFGDGTTKNGKAQETHVYAANKTFTATVSVTDGKSSPIVLSITVNTAVTTVSIDASQKFQTMYGFGGFGAQDVYWSSAPLTSDTFVHTLMNDLGLTILRDNIPTDFEVVNDNNDPHVTDLSKFNLNNNTPGYNLPLGTHINYLKAMKAAGLTTLITSVWSPPAWMKTNNNVNGAKADAPAYSTSPTAANNQLRTDMYEEFAEMCVAYVKIIKQQTGIDVYALSVQNEPRFTEPYESCVYNGEALRDLIKVVGKRFKDEGLTTKLFMPEDVGYFDGINSLVQPVMADAVARGYVDIIATHGYAFDGITAASTDAQTWQKMYAWGQPYGKPLWMTETSGFTNDYKGAMDMAKAMYTAINFGNISAWVHWSLSTSNLDGFCLMSSSGVKSKRYFVSKNFYRYIRPGAYRIAVSVDESSNIFSLAFKNDGENSNTIVLINTNADSRAVKLSGAGLPTDFSMYVTSEAENCKDHGTVHGEILLPANAIVTLYKKN